MRRVLLPLICVIFLCPALRAQRAEEKNACYSGRAENAPYKKKLWDGYEISLGPVRNPEETEYRCTAAIYNSAGRVVFRTNGFKVVFDEELTGEDFDGDGKPEVVLKTDTGGGNHCCWGYIIYSLSPRPHKLFEIAVEGRVDIEKDKDGKMVIWKRTGGTFEDTPMADGPFAEKVFRVREGKLVDATPEFCGKNLSDETEDRRIRIAKRMPTPEELSKLPTNGVADANNVVIVSALLSRALQHVLCRQFDEALADLNLWPEASRTKMKADFADSIREDYPEFAAKLREPAKRN
jgi:hypothetical protein